MSAAMIPAGFPTPLADDEIYILGAYIDPLAFTIRPVHRIILALTKSSIDDLFKLISHLRLSNLLPPPLPPITPPWKPLPLDPQLFAFLPVTTPDHGNRFMATYLHWRCYGDALRASRFLYVNYKSLNGKSEDVFSGVCLMQCAWAPEKWLEEGGGVEGMEGGGDMRKGEAKKWKGKERAVEEMWDVTDWTSARPVLCGRDVQIQNALFERSKNGGEDESADVDILFGERRPGRKKAVTLGGSASLVRDEKACEALEQQQYYQKLGKEKEKENETVEAPPSSKRQQKGNEMGMAEQPPPPNKRQTKRQQREATYQRLKKGVHR